MINYIIDFIVGGLIANAMPHFIMGITETRFLGLFGFSPKGNILYALLQFVFGVSLYAFFYGFDGIINNGVFLGGAIVMLLFFLFGRSLLRIFSK